MANGKKKDGGEAETFLEQVEERYKQSYAGRLKKARDVQKKLEDENDLLKVRAAETEEEARRQIAELKRGNTSNLLEVCGSAAAGVALGVLAQKTFDARVGGVPLTGLLGIAGVGLGAMLKEDFGIRAFFAVGGTGFAAGATAYALLNPLPPETTETGVV